MPNTHIEHPEDSILSGDLRVLRWFTEDGNISVKIDDIAFKVDENTRTVTLVNKLFWVVIVAAAGAIATHMWM